MSIRRSDALRRLISEARRLQKLADLGSWRIDVVFGKADGKDSIAHIGVLEDYENATVTIDPDRHDTIEEMEDSLRHEFIHILLAPLAQFPDIVAEANGEDFRPMSKTWESLEEKTVTRLERTDLLGKPKS